MGSEDELIPVVNMQDEIIGYKRRGDITTDDIYRVASCWVKNSKGDILLAQRALSKKHGPGIWVPLVNGTVGQGESYTENIIHEVYEEVGLQVTVDDFVSYQKLYGGTYWKRFVMYYVYIWDGDMKNLTLDPYEISQVQRYSPGVLRKDALAYPEKYFNGIIWCIDNL